MDRPIDRVLSQLGDYKRNGNSYRAHCPAHIDKHPSLDVTETVDGKVLVKCRSQKCPFPSIVSALGLNKADFFPSSNGQSSRWTQEDADAALTNRGLRPETIERFKITPNLSKQAWGYPLIKDGPLKYKAFAPVNGSPKFWVETGARAGAYHLGSCKDAPDAWLVEGEPDVWTMHQASLKAFTFSCGAGTIPKGAVEQVANANVGTIHVVYDNDDSGRQGAAGVAAAFVEAGIKHTVRQLPGSVGDKGDVTTLYNNLDRDDERFRAALQDSEVADPVAEWGGNGNCAVSAVSAVENEQQEWPTQEWPTLEPLQSISLPTFPVHCLPSPFAQYVRELATTTQTPLALPGSLVLAVLATAVQKKYVLEVRSDYREPLNLFLAVVLDPGNRKSAVFSHVIHPVAAYEERLAKSEGVKVAQLRAERDILEERLKKTKGKAASAEKWVDKEMFIKEAQEIAVDLEQRPEPHLPRFLVDDITPEKLASVLAQQGGRIGLLSAEGNVFSVMAGRYSTKGEPNFEVYLKGHSGDSLVVDRIGGRQDRVPNPALTIGVAIQPTVLRGMAQNREFRGRGLVARFLYSIPESPLGSRNVSPPSMSEVTCHDYEARVQALLGLQSNAQDDGTESPHVLRLDPRALERLHDFAREVEGKLAPSGEFGAMTDWAGKIVGASARLAGLLHVSEHGNQTLGLAVSADLMSRAIGLARYFIEHAKAAYGEMGADPALEGAKILAAWLARNPSRTTFSKRDAFNSHRTYFEKAEHVDPCLALLEEHAHIRPLASERSGGPGRNPSPRYEAHPDLLTQNTHITQKPPLGGIPANSAYSAVSAVGSTLTQDDHLIDDQTVDEEQDPPDRDVLDMAREFVGGHPESSQEEIVEYLVEEGVSRAKSELAAKSAAKGLVAA